MGEHSGYFKRYDVWPEDGWTQGDPEPVTGDGECQSCEATSSQHAAEIVAADDFWDEPFERSRVYYVRSEAGVTKRIRVSVDTEPTFDATEEDA